MSICICISASVSGGRSHAPCIAQSLSGRSRDYDANQRRYDGHEPFGRMCLVRLQGHSGKAWQQDGEDVIVMVGSKGGRSRRLCLNTVGPLVQDGSGVLQSLVIGGEIQLV